MELHTNEAVGQKGQNDITAANETETDTEISPPKSACVDIPSSTLEQRAVSPLAHVPLVRVRSIFGTPKSFTLEEGESMSSEIVSHIVKELLVAANVLKHSAQPASRFRASKVVWSAGVRMIILT